MKSRYILNVSFQMKTEVTMKDTIPTHVIPKGKKIVFHLKRGNSLYTKQNFERIEWYAYNSGLEAENNKMSRHDFNKSNHNNVICETSAAYLGHHYVECKIIKDHTGTDKFTFPIFVQ